MADEPRRSGRATKGQHKNLELPDAPSKKGKGKGQKDKSSKASAEPTPGPSEEGFEEEEEIIRCICGEYEEEEDVERDMICCDKCLAWQHNDCMGLNFAKGEEPDQYYCEQCRPENHKELLDKVAKGEKPWEELAERRRREAEEKKSKRKKGKKGGRKTRPSEGKLDAGTPARAGTSATPGPAQSPTTGASVSAEPEKNGTAADSRRSSTNKRKLEENAPAEPEPQPKQQRFSPQSTTTTDPKIKTEPAPVDTFDASLKEPTMPARKSAATALIKFFAEQVNAAGKGGSSVKVPPGQSTNSWGRFLGISVESAMYENHWGGSGEPSDPYKAQLRAILFNVKKNVSLRDRVLLGRVSPKTLSTMTSDEMASEELQRKDAEIKREAERQHIIVQEQGPRIRRTHKGEELIEDDAHNVASESVFSAAPRQATDAGASPENQSPETPRAPQSTKGDGHTRGQSPDGGHVDHVFPEVAPNIREPVPHGKLEGDADIDKLLDDEPESPPYSPKDMQEDGLIWRGKVSMHPVAEFVSTAQHVGGADLSGRIPWSELVPQTLAVDGRIDVQRANAYLCGLRWSSSTDVSVIAINKPHSSNEQDGFDKLFEYFYTRQRYGVIGKHPLPSVKDTYIVPLEVGASNMPEFIELLENTKLADGPIEERLLLVVFVVKTRESNTPSVQPSSHQPSQEPTIAASPLTAVTATPQNTFMMGQSPLNPSGLGAATPNQATQYQSPQQPLTGMAAALQLLGQNAHAQAIQKLLQTAPQAEYAQLSLVANILERQPAAAHDYDLLMQALFDTQANGHV